MKIKKAQNQKKAQQNKLSKNAFLKKAEPSEWSLLGWQVIKNLPSIKSIEWAGATTRKGLISHECYPYRARQSVVHRGRWSQTNGWALRHHSSKTFFASH